MAPVGSGATEPAPEAHVELRLGDCRAVMRALEPGSVRLAYVDPPFFTQRVQRLRARDTGGEYAFSDVWSGRAEYREFLQSCLAELRRVLRDDGSLFVHCDRRASHVARAVLDDTFGPENFRAEIVWHYRRWSNARRGLLPAHQTLYWYSRGSTFVFNAMYAEYSPATNVDQILQRRARDGRGKAVYDRDADGRVLPCGDKRGVPLSDVWDIPYLNPKAKERVGYPTQKPLLLLERIIALASEPGDRVLDPCCGSGTTLVAARRLGRAALGIDRSEHALELTRRRLGTLVRTESAVLEKGRESYRELEPEVLSAMSGLDVVPVHRNRGIDGVLRRMHDARPVAVRVQRNGESLDDAAAALWRAGTVKHCARMILIATEPHAAAGALPEGVVVVESAALQVARALDPQPARSLRPSA